MNPVFVFNKAWEEELQLSRRPTDHSFKSRLIKGFKKGNISLFFKSTSSRCFL